MHGKQHKQKIITGVPVYTGLREHGQQKAGRGELA